MRYSRTILECLFHTPHLELKKLYLEDITTLSALECVRLANLVQRCVSLNLQSVSFKGTKMGLPDFFSNGGNCIVGQLLRPPIRLHTLKLEDTCLDDRHFLPIVEMLPTTQLQVLDVSGNRIGYQGILAFAQNLPRIKYLIEVSLDCNPWERYDYAGSPEHASYRECIAALLQGMIENYSIDRLCVSRWRREMQLEYGTGANRARRQMLEIATGASIPVGLWPWILERIATRNGDPEWDEELIFLSYRASFLYFVMQNCPIFSLIRSSPLPRRRLRK